MEEKNCCKECCRELTNEETKKYRGFCRNCYKERFENKATNNSSLNTYHKITLIYAIILFIVSIIAGFTFVQRYEDFNAVAMFVVLAIDFVTSFLFFMLSTIIEELRN